MPSNQADARLTMSITVFLLSPTLRQADRPRVHGRVRPEPHAGIRFFESVQEKMGPAVASFARLYEAPGVDHVGSGAPANVDMLAGLANWVENGKAPGTLTVVEQTVETGPKTVRALPLCQWPMWPKYKTGDATQAESFECVK